MDMIANTVMADNYGNTLLLHITASMAQRITKTPVHIQPQVDGPQLLHSLENRIVYYAGHDINLLFLKQLLR